MLVVLTEVSFSEGDCKNEDAKDPAHLEMGGHTPLARLLEGNLATSFIKNEHDPCVMQQFHVLDTILE